MGCTNCMMGYEGLVLVPSHLPSFFPLTVRYLFDLNREHSTTGGPSS